MDLIEQVKAIFRGSKKQRQDSFCDQFSRKIMVQVMTISAVACGMSWFSDKLNCIVPDHHSLSPNFVAEACWINGFYLFREIKNIPNELGYYGIPDEVNHNGMDKDGKQCEVGPNHPDCKEMERTFFVQFQWFPFFMASLAIFYYAPYICYKLANHDLISLQKAALNKDDEGITRYFFDHKMNNPRHMLMRTLTNIFVRIFYIIAYIASFFLIDKALYGYFQSYGKRWISWIGLTNEQMYDYTANRDLTKPGEVMLPTFGLCEVREGGLDERHQIANKHTFICEYSPHILYHYVLILVFFLICIGLGISTFGLVQLCVNYYRNVKRISAKIGKSRKFTLREYEYLEILDRFFPALRQRVLQRLAHADEPQEKREIPQGVPQGGQQQQMAPGMAGMTPEQELRWRANAMQQAMMMQQQQKQQEV